MRGQPRHRTAFPFHLPAGRTIHSALYAPPHPQVKAVAEAPLLPDLTLVLGGARSGKSRYAESLFGPGPRRYIATAQAFDQEMRARIAAHRAGRAEAGWETDEEPLDLAGALRRAAADPVLVDCLTLWLSNLMLTDSALTPALAAAEAALAERGAQTVLVSNEVGFGIVPENALARRFRDEAGRLHQRLAAQADRVVLVVAGLPMRVK